MCLGTSLLASFRLKSAKLFLPSSGHACCRRPGSAVLACEWCHRGHTNLCPHVRFLGYAPIDGALAEFVSVAPSALHPVPRELEPADAAILETLGVAIHAIDLARIRFMETVAVLGCGAGRGLLLVQLARLSGAGTIVASRSACLSNQACDGIRGERRARTIPKWRTSWTGAAQNMYQAVTDSARGFRPRLRASRIGGRLVVGRHSGRERIISSAAEAAPRIVDRISRRDARSVPARDPFAASGRSPFASTCDHP